MSGEVPQPPKAVAQLLDWGCAVIPLQWTRQDGSCSCARPGCPSTGKHPIHPAWEQHASSDPARVAAWARRWPHCNWGWVMGSGYLALDLDRKRGQDGVASLHELEAEHGTLPRACCARTPSGGFHLILHNPNGAALVAATDWLPGVDIRAGNSLIAVEPSTTPVGVYTFARCERPPDAPAWLLELLPHRDDGSGNAEVVVDPVINADLPERAQQLLGMDEWFQRTFTHSREKEGDGSDSSWDFAVLVAFLHHHPDASDQELADLICAHRVSAHGGGWAKRKTAKARTDYMQRTITRARRKASEQFPGEIPQVGVMRTTFPGAVPGAEALWQRPALAIVSQAAHHRGRSPWAVLGVLLARLAALTPPLVKVPAIVGATSTLNLIVAPTGAPGTGKGTSAMVAAELLPFPPEAKVRGPLSIGTGEGIAQAYYEIASDPDNERRKVNTRAYNNVLFVADEGQAVAAMASRQGSVLLAALRTTFSGAPLGQANAEGNRYRVLDAGTYAAGVVINLQPETAAPLLADTAAGTPQRVLFIPAIDPGVPDEAPPWPEAWRITHAVAHALAPVREPASPEVHLTVPDAIRHEVRQADLRRSRGQAAGDPWQAHRDLMRLKVAGLLAILEGRLGLTEDDWDAAGVVLAVGDRVRDHAQEAVAREAAQQEAAASRRQATRKVMEVEHLEARQLRRTVEAAERLRDQVESAPGITVAEVRRALRRWREVFAGALDHALAEGWVEEHTEQGQGTPKRVLHPGSTR